MTDEFAIKILEQYREKPTLINEIETVEEAVWLDEALDMAIKALEQESASTQEYGLTDADTDKYAVQVQNGEGYYNSFGRYVSYDLD